MGAHVVSLKKLHEQRDPEDRQHAAAASGRRRRSDKDCERPRPDGPPARQDVAARRLPRDRRSRRLTPRTRDAAAPGTLRSRPARPGAATVPPTQRVGIGIGQRPQEGDDVAHLALAQRRRAVGPAERRVALDVAAIAPRAGRRRRALRPRASRPYQRAGVAVARRVEAHGLARASWTTPLWKKRCAQSRRCAATACGTAPQYSARSRRSVRSGPHRPRSKKRRIGVGAAARGCAARRARRSRSR